MPHETPLIAAIVIGFVFAFIFGTIANKLKIPPLVGYFLSGFLVGPHTPGLVIDQSLAFQLAEIGIILLMFGVGLNFSFKDLLSVRFISIPGALIQIIFSTFLGMILSWFFGWSMVAGIVFGLALSVASTAVLLRTLQEERLLETERGRIAVGWLIVEDMVMIFVLILLPAMVTILGAKINPNHPAIQEHWTSILQVSVFKISCFMMIMFMIGRRLIPWILQYVAHTGSRELFRLAVLAIALGVSFGSAKLFGVSLSLGAFFAGMIMRESKLSQRAAEETLPLRDAFSVLFFVSVGMIFNPVTLIDNIVPTLLVLLVIIVGKSLISFFTVIAFGYSISTALMISASLAQIGEFSFILADLGKNLNILPEKAQDLIFSGAIFSILLNPIIFLLFKKIEKHYTQKKSYKSSVLLDHPLSIHTKKEAIPCVSTLKNHTILVGCGRIGKSVCKYLQFSGMPFLVIEDNEKILSYLRQKGIETIDGNAVNEAIFSLANPAAARQLILTIPNSFEAGQIILRARFANPMISIIARADSITGRDHLKEIGAKIVILEEEEIARGIIQKIKGR